MSVWELTIRVNVDDESLAQHDAHDVAPPNDIEDWFDGDVFEAHDKGFIEPVHDEIKARKIED